MGIEISYFFFPKFEKAVIFSVSRTKKYSKLAVLSSTDCFNAMPKITKIANPIR